MSVGFHRFVAYCSQPPCDSGPHRDVLPPTCFSSLRSFGDCTRPLCVKRLGLSVGLPAHKGPLATPLRTFRLSTWLLCTDGLGAAATTFGRSWTSCDGLQASGHWTSAKHQPADYRPSAPHGRDAHSQAAPQTHRQALWRPEDATPISFSCTLTKEPVEGLMQGGTHPFSLKHVACNGRICGLRAEAVQEMLPQESPTERPEIQEDARLVGPKSFTGPFAYESWPQSAMTTGLEVLPDWEPTASIFFTTSMPSVTAPNTQCLPSSQPVFTVHRKNWEPLVLGPAFAMDKIPGPVCFRVKFSSANLAP